jgi:exonuclease III
MIILSLNCRGLANPSKKLVIKILVDTHNPSILFIQETMLEGDKAIKNPFLISTRLGFYGHRCPGKVRGAYNGMAEEFTDFDKLLGHQG